ncbi:MAG: hypothetical protein ABIR96_03485 [Bdellovibrionota bacterium]
MNSLEILRDALDVALLRIESGQPLAKAVADAPRFECEKDWVERWTELRSRLLRGESSALEGLTQFRRSVDLQLKIGRLVTRRSLLPLIQSGAVGLTSMIFLVATQTLFRDLFHLTSIELAVAISLLGVGYLWMWKLVHDYRRELWFIDWLEFVSGLSARLSWGQGLLPAWKYGLASTARLPKELREFLTESFRKAENYEVLPTPRLVSKEDALVFRCRTRWEQVHRLFVANERVLPVLVREIENAFESFQDGLERKAELLSAKLMLPLFLCFAPAYLLMLMAPLIRPLLVPAAF